MDGTNGSGRLQTAEVGQPNVHRYIVRLELAGRLNSSFTGGAFNETVAGSGQQLADHVPHTSVVIYDHHIHNFVGQSC